MHPTVIAVDLGDTAVGTEDRASSWASVSCRSGGGRRKHAHSAGRLRMSVARGVEETRIFAVYCPDRCCGVCCYYCGGGGD